MFFVEHMKEVLERVLNRTIMSWPSIQDMMEFCYTSDKIRYDSVTEFIQLNSKHLSFMRYCLYYEKGHHCVLIDDVVPNLTIIDKDTHTTIDTINKGLIINYSGNRGSLKSIHDV